VAVERNLVPLLGGTFEQVPNAYCAASPMTYANRGGPPFLLLHDAADRVVPPAQAQALAEKLRDAGGSARAVLLEGPDEAARGQAMLRGFAEVLNFFNER